MTDFANVSADHVADETSEPQRRQPVNQSSRTKWHGWLTAIIAAYWLAMFIGTHIPNPEAIIGPEVSDKLLHFLAYFVLTALLLTRLQTLNRSWPTGWRMARLLSVVCIYATADELLQGIPGINRHPDVLDALADMSGAAGACLIFVLLSCIRAD